MEVPSLENVERVEYRGKSYAGMDATVLIDELTEDEARDVVVYFRDGVRTSLPKLLAAQGDDAVRIDGDVVKI